MSALMGTADLPMLELFLGMNEAWDSWVSEGATPARATVQVSKLADPGWKLGENVNLSLTYGGHNCFEMMPYMTLRLCPCPLAEIVVNAALP